MKDVTVVVAFGVGTRDWPYVPELVKFLNGKAIKHPVKADHWTYKLPKKKLNYNIRLVYTKAEFQKALNEKGAIVIYDGHSRYGQGPAFGPKGLSECPDKALFPKNPWEDHYRMGWDTINIPCKEEIIHHCTNPTEFPYKNTPKGFFAKKRVKVIVNIAAKRTDRCNQKGYAKRKLLKCDSIFASKANGRGDKTLLNRHYWYQQGGDYHTLVQVGRDDLKKSRLECSVLFMNSCKSKWHFYYALRREKRSNKSKCVFYMTRRLRWSYAWTTNIFIKTLLDGHDPKGKRGYKKFLKAMTVPGWGNVEYLR